MKNLLAQKLKDFRNLEANECIKEIVDEGFENFAAKNKGMHFDAYLDLALVVMLAYAAFSFQPSFKATPFAAIVIFACFLFFGAECVKSIYRAYLANRISKSTKFRVMSIAFVLYHQEENQYVKNFIYANLYDFLTFKKELPDGFDNLNHLQEYFVNGLALEISRESKIGTPARVEQLGDKMVFIPGSYEDIPPLYKLNDKLDLDGAILTTSSLNDNKTNE